jgi:hypothetical protein
MRLAGYFPNDVTPDGMIIEKPQGDKDKEQGEDEESAAGSDEGAWFTCCTRTLLVQKYNQAEKEESAAKVLSLLALLILCLVRKSKSAWGGEGRWEMEEEAGRRRVLSKVLALLVQKYEY